MPTNGLYNFVQTIYNKLSQKSDVIWELHLNLCIRYAARKLVIDDRSSLNGSPLKVYSSKRNYSRSIAAEVIHFIRKT